jgi:hypothetical protein
MLGATRRTTRHNHENIKCRINFNIVYLLTEHVGQVVTSGLILESSGSGVVSEAGCTYWTSNQISVYQKFALQKHIRHQGQL